MYIHVCTLCTAKHTFSSHTSVQGEKLHVNGRRIGLHTLYRDLASVHNLYRYIICVHTFIHVHVHVMWVFDCAVFYVLHFDMNSVMLC